MAGHVKAMTASTPSLRPSAASLLRHVWADSSFAIVLKIMFHCVLLKYLGFHSQVHVLQGGRREGGDGGQGVDLGGGQREAEGAARRARADH